MQEQTYLSCCEDGLRNEEEVELGENQGHLHNQLETRRERKEGKALEKSIARVE